MSLQLHPISRPAWHDLARSFADYNYRQIWEYGIASAARTGSVSEHVAVEQDGQIVGMADVRIKKLPLLPTGIAYINGGPLVRRGQPDDAKALFAVLETLIDAYASKRGYVLRIRPPLATDAWNQALERGYRQLEFVPAPAETGYRTIVLDLALSLEELRKQLNQKWRNCLNHAEKRGLTVTSSTAPEAFDDFCVLYAQLLERKSFKVDQDARFFAQLQRSLGSDEQFIITLVHASGEPVAGHVASLLGDTCIYLLGASSSAGLELKAPYLLQWSVIQSAKEKGCRWYDLGGIDPEVNPGVHQFKKRMGGQDVTVCGPFEYRPGGWQTIAVNLGQSVYRRMAGR